MTELQLEQAKYNLEEAQVYINKMRNNLELLQEYKVKDIWRLPEYEDGSKWIASTFSIAIEGDSLGYTEAGRRRATRALAERCAKASKTRDLCEAWRDHIEPTWRDINNYATCIYVEDTKYYITTSDTRRLGTVYGSQETMEKICDALNNGEIIL